MKKILLLIFTLISFLQLIAQNTLEVNAKIDFSVEERNSPNEIISADDISNKIYSAPVAINFFGEGGKDAYYYTWYFYKKTDLENAFVRYTDKDIRYTSINSVNI